MAAMFRIVKLDGAEKYKVQEFIQERKKWFGLRRIPAGWVDKVYRETYGGKSFFSHSLDEAERHVEQLKHKRLIEKDQWTVVKGDL